jgi:DNA replication protein DnaC
MTAAAPAASPAPPQVLLAHHLRQLKLPTFVREYEKVAAEAARERLDHVRFLLRLAELELIDRERRMVERRIRAALSRGEEFRHVQLHCHSIAQQAARSRTGPL